MCRNTVKERDIDAGVHSTRQRDPRGRICDGRGKAIAVLTFRYVDIRSIADREILYVSDYSAAVG